MHLGPEAVRLVPFIKENKQIQSIDLSNNGLSQFDVHQLEYQLAVANEEPLKTQRALL